MMSNELTTVELRELSRKAVWSAGERNVLEVLSPMLREVNGVLSLCVDGSALAEMHRCPKASYYKLIRRRVSSRDDRSLTFGKVCAVAWDWRYRTCGNRAMSAWEQEQQAQLIERSWPGYGESAVDLGDMSDPLAGASVEEQGKRAYLHSGRCKDVMRLYNQEYGEEPFEVVA